MAKFSNSLKCRRNSGCNDANHYHTFWECLLYIFKNIGKKCRMLLNIFRRGIPLESKLLYIGCVCPDIVEADNKYLMDVLLTASKMANHTQMVKTRDQH